MGVGRWAAARPAPRFCPLSGLDNHGLAAERARDTARIVLEGTPLRLRQPPERVDRDLDLAASLRALPGAGDAAVDEDRRVGPAPGGKIRSFLFGVRWSAGLEGVK